MERLISYRSYLSPLERAHVDSIVPIATQFAFEEANNHIYRWKGGIEFEIAYPEVEETDHDHILGCLELVTIYQQYFPHILQDCSINDLKVMLVIHDSDEIMVQRDIPMLHPILETKEGAKIKRVGRLLAVNKLFSRYVCADKHAYVTDLYQRFLDQKPNDKEALIARYIDKAQGNHFGAEYVFPYQPLGLSTPGAERKHHVSKSLEKILIPAIPLFSLLKYPGRKELDALVTHDIDRFIDIVTTVL